MNFFSNALILFVAVEHLAFLILEMFLWTKPIGLKIFKMDFSFAERSATLAANQGLYNGFLSSGLFWAIFNTSAEFSFSLKLFFLSCVLIAGLYGGYSVGKSILLIQALPAALAMTLLLFLR